MRAAPSRIDRLLRPLHRWVWADARRRGRKLLRFSATEADGGRDISRAAELTRDSGLRRLYLRHAEDEHRHAGLFQQRARALLTAHRGEQRFEANWLSPGERGLDDLRVDRESDETLLAFLHLSEKAAAGRFALYAEVLDNDPETRALFARILEDEAFHMTYTRKQLARLSPQKHGLRLWQARAGRVWSAYLRLAVALASLLGRALLTLQYFVVLPVFAFLARRRREPEGFSPARRQPSLKSQY
ncbi:MAG TPA: ferritin-like domain-containing protein [Myxococcales bacterium]